MSEREVEQKATKMLEKMSGGSDVTVDYNRMSSQEQKEIFDAMQKVKGSGKFSDVTITGTDDGRMADAQTKKGFFDISRMFGSPTIDTYDSPQDLDAKIRGNAEGIARALGTNTRQEQLDKQEQRYKY